MNIVFDIETDGLLPGLTKIHVMSWMDLDTGVIESTSDLSTMRHIIGNASTIIGHNIISFDLPVLKFFEIHHSKNVKIVDTLPLSWYLFPNRIRHGLESWGATLGTKKPEIKDWDNLTYEEYKHRCEEDVKINERLWFTLRRKLDRLYSHDPDGNKTDSSKIIDYLNFKMTCAYDQEVFGWRLDTDKAKDLHDRLERLKTDAEDAVIDAMPPVPITRVMNPPKVMYRKDGTLSARGEAWQEALRANYMPASTNTPITVLEGHKPANPNSNTQVKDWLHSLGWKPKTFKYVREDDGSERKIEQVRDGEDLCESVTELAEQHPAIKHLADLTVLTHRLGIVKGFLECVDYDGRLVAGIAGLTNTLRFKHRKPLVNLPGVDKPWGEDIRGCLIASEGRKLIGCDMVSLEDTTKRHYMQPIDPDYVEEMEKDGFDPHLDLAKHAGEDITGPNVKTVRKAYKAANYACVYGVGPQTLSRATGLTVMKSKKLIEAYWERNAAVKKVAETRKVRKIDDETWIYNEVSGFWHSLRYDKDRWSTTNQSTGVFVFDTFVRLVKREGLRVVGQFHDEIIVDSDDTDTDTKALDYCCELLNDELKLNVPLHIDYSVGDTYAEIH